MRKKTEILGRTMLTTLIRELLASPHNTPLTREEIVQVMTDVIKNTYTSCKLSQRAQLYRELSILLHPDRFVHDQQLKELVDYLKKHELIEEPQKILNEIHHKQSSESIINFFKEVFNLPSNSLDILTRRMSDNPLINNLKRYVVPFNLIINLVFLGFLIGKVIFAVLAGVSYAILNLLIDVGNSLVSSVINIITDNKYEQMVDFYKTANFSAYKKKFLDDSRKKFVSEANGDGNTVLANALMNMNDDQFSEFVFDKLKNERISSSEREETDTIDIEEFLNEEIKSSTSVFSVDRIKSTFFALYDAGVDVTKGKMSRAISLIASPFLLVAVTLGELSLLTTHGIFFALSIAEVTASYLFLMVLNIPLVLYDVSVEVLYRDSDMEDEVTVDKIKTPLSLLYSPTNIASQSTPVVEPVHFSSPISGPYNDVEVVGTQEVEQDVSVSVECSGVSPQRN